jgi:hypothetical protein
MGLQRDRQLVQHTHHRDAASCFGVHELQPIGLVRRIQVRQRFVHQQHLGLHREGAREQHALALAAGEFGQRPLAPGATLGGLHRPLDRRVVLHAGRGEPARLVRQAAEHHDVHRTQVVADTFVLPKPGEPTCTLLRRP